MRRPELKEMERIEIVAADYMTTGLCTHGHPMEYLRGVLRERGILSAEELPQASATAAPSCVLPVLLIERMVLNEQGVVNVQARHIEAIVPQAGADVIDSHDFH